jgi:hypothetical protein
VPTAKVGVRKPPALETKEARLLVAIQHRARLRYDYPAEAGPADGESCQVKTSQRQINEPLPGLEAPQQLQRLAAPAYINSAEESR